jgi:SAM-dependent methyltransferase
VCCSGVLQHTARPVATLQEISRVLKPGGRVYMLVYATEGVRWPLVQMLRPLAQRIGFVAIDAAITADGIPVNKRRTYLDDLFVPYIDFYSWPALHDLLMAAEFEHVERWVAARFDQEEDLTCRISSDQWLLENSAERTG